jgi:hypothetical protein
MEQLLEEIKNLNRLMLPYLKPETYEEFMNITHKIIILVNEWDDKKIQSKFQNIYETLQDNADYKMKFNDAQSKIRDMEVDMHKLKCELEIIKQYRCDNGKT